MRPRAAGGVQAVAAVALTAVLLAGCGGHGAATLHDRLLSVADLPAGWSAVTVTKANAPTLTDTPCLSGLSKSPKGLTVETAAFVQGSSVPSFGEVLESGGQVAPAWRRLGRALARCRNGTLRLGGANITVAIRSLAFPRIGRSSSAYAWTFTLGGVRFGADLVLFQTGTYAGFVSYADLGSPRIATVKALARAAAAKAAAGSTARVPDTLSITSAPVQTADTGRGKVAYRTIGNGPPLILVTGYSGTMESWDRRFVDAVAEHHRVIVFDNGGVGGTQALPAPLTIDAMAEQTSALVSALHLGRVDVLGWSMGSMIAQALAVLHPGQVRRLVLCASFPGDGTAVPPSRQELNAFESGEPKKVMAALFPADQTAPRTPTSPRSPATPPHLPPRPPRSRRRDAPSMPGGAEPTPPANGQRQSPCRRSSPTAPPTSSTRSPTAARSRSSSRTLDYSSSPMRATPSSSKTRRRQPR